MASKGKGNPDPKPPSSHGIPASESLWLPSHYGGELKGKGGLDKTVIWSVSDVIDFIFPSKFQPRYHEVATDFITLLLDCEIVTKKEIGKFLTENGYSKATLENKVIPKLVRFGLIKREREFKAGLGKGRSLILSDSLSFTSYLERIGFAWNMLVSTARTKRGRQTSLGGG
ncbi:MAG: hypothetical protein ABH851_07160 [Methanobacteriota archaeon]